MDDVATFAGPLDRKDGKWVFVLPLSSGGDQFVPCTKGIAEIRDDCLWIEIPDWLADKLGIKEGSCIVVDNAGGKFNIRTVY